MLLLFVGCLCYWFGLDVLIYGFDLTVWVCNSIKGIDCFLFAINLIVLDWCLIGCLQRWLLLALGLYVVGCFCRSLVVCVCLVGLMIWWYCWLFVICLFVLLVGFSFVCLMLGGLVRRLLVLLVFLSGLCWAELWFYVCWLECWSLLGLVMRCFGCLLLGCLLIVLVFGCNPVLVVFIGCVLVCLFARFGCCLRFGFGLFGICLLDG